MVADEIQPCHRIGRHMAVQSVSDDHIVLIEASQKARHFVRCVGAVSIQHNHGIGIQAKRFSEAMSDSASLADIVLVNQQNAVLLCDLFGAVRAVAVHHQNRCFVPHRFQSLVGKAVQHPCQSQGLIEYREHDNEMLHDRSSGLLPHVFAVHGSVDQVNHWSLTPVLSSSTVSLPESPSGLSHLVGSERSHSRFKVVSWLALSTAKQAWW